MPTVEEKCVEFCGGREEFNINSVSERRKIAFQLAKYLLDSDAINTVWNCSPQYKIKDTIVSYLRYLDEGTIGQLLTKGLDLNIEIHNGVTRFTWMIGNAEKDWADELSDKYQTREQRLTWINKTDSMIRFTENLCFILLKLRYVIRHNFHESF